MISLHNMLPFELTKDTPYLALSGELWSVFYEYFNRNWSCYKGFLLYQGTSKLGQYWSCSVTLSHRYVCKRATRFQRDCAIFIHTKCIFNSNFVKSHLHIINCLFVISFCKFVQSTAVILPYSVQIFKMIAQLKWMFRTNGVSQDLSVFLMDILNSTTPLLSINTDQLLQINKLNNP